MDLDIRAYVAAVPEMDRFLTVDELLAGFERLAGEYPDIARLKRVGTSKLGEPIDMLSIGSGSRNMLMFGCPHPNEPIGAMLIHHLTELLCIDADLRDRYDYTWHFISTVDPDGTRLNEGWFGGPFTPTNYARHFYRPAAKDQVEWTFPISYKKHYFDASLPETEMLMRVIDELKPDLMASLHNAGFSGVYYYSTEGDQAYYDTLHALPDWEGLPLAMGEAEVPWATPLANAIFPLLSTTDAYDYLEANGGNPGASESGGSSFDYSQRYGTFNIVTEVAYFDDPRVNDESPTTTNRREAILASLDAAEASRAMMKGHWDAVVKDLGADSPFRRTVDWWVNELGSDADAERNWARENPDTDRPATVAELFSSQIMPQFFRLCWQGLIVRMLEGEVGIGNGTPGIRRELVAARDTFERWGAQLESELDFRTVPIRKLVGVQFGAVLAAAEYLSRQRAISA
jgi:hypothetical protein